MTTTSTYHTRYGGEVKALNYLLQAVAKKEIEVLGCELMDFGTENISLRVTYG